MARESEMWTNNFEVERNYDMDNLINYEVSKYELFEVDYGSHFTTNEVKLKHLDLAL